MGAAATRSPGRPLYIYRQSASAAASTGKPQAIRRREHAKNLVTDGVSLYSPAGLRVARWNFRAAKIIGGFGDFGKI